MHTTLQKLRSWGQTSLRKQDDATFKTDSGNLIVDLSCGPIDDPRALDMELRSLPGVVETGLFCGRADIVLVAGPAGVQVLKRSEELL
jgi:ribose 5-phosphate isomerase A